MTKEIIPMKHAYHIKILAAFWVAVGIICFASAPAMAWDQNPTGKCMNCDGSESGSGDGGGYSAPAYDYGAAQRAQEAETAAAAERQVEADRIERERQAEEQRKKEAEEKRQKELFNRNRDAAANSLKGSTGSAMEQLKGLGSADNAGLKGGNGFDTGGTGLKGLRGSDPAVDDRNEPAGLGGQSNFKGAIAKPGKPAPHTDTSVVDARVPHDGAYLTGQVPELKNSPAADRITKGFQAVINHDWPVALAWWRDALNHDPSNAALKRSVDLAQWMVDRGKTKTTGPVTPLGAAIYSASRGDGAKAIRQFELIKKENPAIAPQVDDMIKALRQRQAKDANDTKLAADRLEEYNRSNQRIVDHIFERGMNYLSIGDEKGAQGEFADAAFVGGLFNVQPSQLPAPKAGKTK